MTEFKRASQAVDEVESLVQALLDSGSSPNVQRLSVLVGETCLVIERLSRKALETDPLKQTYGPQMCDKVRALAQRWASVEPLAKDVLGQHGASVTAPGPGPLLAAAPPPRVAVVVRQSVTVPSAPAQASTNVQTGEDRRQLALRAAEARLREAAVPEAGSSSRPPSSGTCSESKPRPMDVDSSPAVSAVARPAPVPVVARMDALVHLVHSVFVSHGYQRADSETPNTECPFRVLYTKEGTAAIIAAYVPVQRHLVVYASMEENSKDISRVTVQIGMPAATVQAKVDYLLVYPLICRQCVPSLPSVPPEVCFNLLSMLALPQLAAVGYTSKTLSFAVFHDDLLWWQVLLCLPTSPQLRAVIASLQGVQTRGEVLQKGSFRLAVREEVSRARAEAEERRRRREEQERLARNMRDPLMIGQPRRPQPFPGLGPGFGGIIGGPSDLFPGGGFGQPFGGPGRRPFGGGFGGGGFGGGLM